MATAALNELLDANRAYVRELMDALTNEFPARNCILLFPDRKEANLARKVYGEVKFTISSIPKKAPTYMADTEMKENGVIVIVQPGFNVEEYMCMPNVMGCAPVVCVNGDLDRVRGAYYPRLFYPGLYKVKEKFLSMFEEVFYVKAFSNGGSLMRRFPEKWRLFYKGTGDMREVWTGDDRPDFKDVERILRDCRTADLRAR